MQSVAERFETKVKKTRTHHLWTGATNTAGVGQMRVDCKLTTARRVAWELKHGPLPAGARVDGCAGSVACVRVEHLSLAGSSRLAPRSTAAAAGGGSKREVRADVAGAA